MPSKSSSVGIIYQEPIDIVECHYYVLQRLGDSSLIFMRISVTPGFSVLWSDCAVKITHKCWWGGKRIDKIEEMIREKVPSLAFTLIPSGGVNINEIAI